VALLLSWPEWKAQQINTPVLNQQVAPTILKLLGLDPDQLDAVRKEQITILPFIGHDHE
jgi:arylsulfatase A-like enzyme